MASSITALEVLQNLNALGYTNITAIQLKEFMQDLKKLVKYNLRRDSESSSSSLGSTSGVIPHYLLHTTSSMAKQKHCELSIKLERETQSCSCAKPVPDVNTSSNMLSINHPVGSSTGSSTAEAPKILIPSKFGGTCKRKCTNRKLKQTAFILPRPPKKILKCDPVELYHKYNKGWKKQNFPGETDHADLRWAVREKLIGQPQVDI